jgi:hydrogenase/urease accessory protein HupE
MSMYRMANLSIHAIWPVSFILVMAAASLLHIQRLMVFYCYPSKVVLTCVESLWWRGIWRTTERQAWSEDFASSSPTALRHYDILNRNPSLLIGLRRALLVVGLMVVFVTVGFTHSDAKWARTVGRGYAGD